MAPCPNRHDICRREGCRQPALGQAIHFCAGHETSSILRAPALVVELLVEIGIKMAAGPEFGATFASSQVDGIAREKCFHYA